MIMIISAYDVTAKLILQAIHYFTPHMKGGHLGMCNHLGMLGMCSIYAVCAYFASCAFKISQWSYRAVKRYLLHSFCVSIVFVNSLLNPIIFSVRIRQIRVAFIELLFRTVNIAQAEQIEMRYFGAANAVIPNEQRNINNNSNPTDINELPQQENNVLEQLNNNQNFHLTIQSPLLMIWFSFNISVNVRFGFT